VAEIVGAGGEALFVTTDVADPAACARLVDAAVERFGGLHIAVNNAGVAGYSGSGARLTAADYPLELWDKVMSVNLSGVFYCIRSQIPAMLKSGGGAIVNMSSVGGQVATAGTPAYVASKHGIVGLSKVIAVEYAQRGIRCNAVGPGFIDTPLTQQSLGHPQVKAALLASIPAGRTGTPEEIADAVLWLCSDRAVYVNGAYIPVDGGFLAR
jgi:NAD(P)-dependent dehydrogenase (short-subunit alcohol dehydrogenase family)